MTHPTCDNECTMLGWTEATVECGGYCLHISHAPDADLDGIFRAFCHDEQEMIRINGWLMANYEEVTQ